MRSIAGPRGGYLPDRPPHTVTLMDVVAAVEGADPAFRCTEIRADGPHTTRCAIDTGDLVFVAGQYGSDTDGHVVSDDFAEQVDRAFANLGTALRAAGLDHRHVARPGTYVVDHDADRLAVLLEHVRRIWGDRPPAQTLLGVATLALPGMLFEVDAVATR